MKGWLVAALALVAAVADGQSAQLNTVQSQVRFSFERDVPGIAVPRYTISIREDGTGEYRAEMKTAKSAEVQTTERKLVFTNPTVEKALAAVSLIRTSGVPCASKIKNIADTGSKTIFFRDAQGDGICSYNYTENKGAAQLTEIFQGIEQTLEEGRALDFKHRFDRLGLDAEISNLMASVDSGRALELGNIAPTLRSIAGDTELIQRVRLRAAKLLERAQSGE